MMQKTRITIVTYNWPPRNAIGTHRPYSWAKYWSELGAEVTVLTAEKYEFDAPLDLLLPVIPNVIVHKVAYLYQEHHLYFLLKFPLVHKFAKWMKNFLSKKAKIPIDIRNKWVKAALPIAENLAESSNIVVSTFGPAASHLIASKMKESNPNLLWVADYRDLWSQNHLAGLSDSQKETIRNIELTTLDKADFLTTVSEDLAQQLSALFVGKEVNIITNGFDISTKELEENIKNYSNKSLNKTKRIVYTGRIYVEHRDPLPLLDSIVALSAKGLISKNSITVDFYGTSSDVIKELIKDKPVYEPFVRLIGHVSRAEALMAQKEADLLLLLESGAQEAKGVLTGKVFEYIASGTPILSLGSAPESAIGNLLKTTRTGICLQQDVNSIEMHLMEVINDSGNLWFNPCIEEILKYSRNEQATKMYNEILIKK